MVAKNIIYWLLFILACFFSSCEKTVTIDAPEAEIKPVINCLFEDEKPFKVNVSMTKAPSDSGFVVVEHAQVEISGDDGTSVSLGYAGNGCYSDSSMLPQKGVTYTLSVKITGFDEITATNKIPEQVVSVNEVTSLTGSKTVSAMGLGENPNIPVQVVTVKFEQDVNYRDYLGVSANIFAVIHHYVNDSIFVTEDTLKLVSGFLESNDPAILNEGLDKYDEYNLLLFKDDVFVQKNSTIQFNVEKLIQSKYWIRIMQLSPEAYTYIKSWVIHRATQEYDFWEAYEPQPLYSNIKNGYGIFAGYSMQNFEVFPDSTVVFK
ncbi:MAG: hypothetical protein CSA36_05410 [Draconibacterium sp.]|nr:MAG: hypothetical protein CSA36_05410 [Draconibacterium sp.]